ncbi:MAG TPA: T9SS type A sorting domain-containing protein [Flavobacteriales bacterium]|nr:T9SS type A sorting domain-containing protein [Flavobacteriales bacterium]
MKKLLSLFAFCILFGYTYCQSLVTSNVTPLVYGDTTAAMEGYCNITNQSGTDLNVIVARTIIDTVIGSEDFICWDVCYPPNCDTTFAMTIASGQTYTYFRGNYLPNGNQGACQIKYCFYDKNNPSDSVCQTITFTTSAVLGVPKEGVENTDVVHFYPNPFTDVLKIDLTDINGELKHIKLLDLAGRSLIMSKTHQLNLVGIPSGTYLCTVTLQSGAVISKQVIKL